MVSQLERYYTWLHGQWPAGIVEKLPAMAAGGGTAIPGVRIAGDLTGIPLLKFAVDSGARAVRAILADPAFSRSTDPRVLDMAIIGGGVAGYAAAREAQKAGLNVAVFEATAPFATIADLPKGKPIYTYPSEMTPAGDIHLTASVKEGLLDELRAQTGGIEPVIQRIERIEQQGGLLSLVTGSQETFAARSAVVAIGRTGNFRKLGVPGEELDKVFYRLHDPRDHGGRDVVVVGGGDSAIEAAIALAEAGARVTLSYRRKEFARPKPENVERLAALSSAGSGRSLTVVMASTLTAVDAGMVHLVDGNGQPRSLPNDVVFAMIGREPPLDFFRRSRLAIAGEWSAFDWTTAALSILFFFWLFHWMRYGFSIGGHGTFFPSVNFPWLDPAVWVAGMLDAFGTAMTDHTSLLYTLSKSATAPGFFYSFIYCALVGIFGWRRIRRRKTPYVRLQTIVLVAIQWIPLFLLPMIVLPWLGRNGVFSDGTLMQPFADAFFERYDAVGEERAYWRAYGFILAWPLFVFNWINDQPLWGWLILGSIQTFVIIPALIFWYGKGAYCGWICSCGALAETVGDAHRHKMPHGPGWNRLNMIGQVFLVFAAVVFLACAASWIFPDSVAGVVFRALMFEIPFLNFKWLVDLTFSGVLGLALYFHLSGRVWCRFACPLAALMHIYARFSRFRIFADKKKCISCNVCTSVCHQGIDVMNFANKGRPMEDPECVRCSACVQSCPTGVLSFGFIGRDGLPHLDALAASPVQMREAARQR